MTANRRLLDADARWSARLRIAERPGPLRTFAMLLAHSGDSWFWGLGLLVVWWLGSTAWKYRALLLLVAIFSTALLVMVLKFLFRRRRPEGNWGHIYRKTDPHSFPSGHAARAGLLIGLGIGLGPWWFALTVLAWAPLMTLARVAMGVHYLSDIVAGFGLGLALAVGWGLALAPLL